jgi:hypothetical protein
MIRTLATLAVAPEVAVHSIIAVRGDGPPEEGGDGVVSYRSAHVEGVESERIIQSGHSVQLHPDAIEEVRRILLVHLNAGDAPDESRARQGTRVRSEDLRHGQGERPGSD